MPFSIMALLALMVIGVFGNLPATAAVLEHSMHAPAANRNAAHPMTTAGHCCDLRRCQLPRIQTLMNRVAAARNPSAQRRSFYGERPR